MYVII